MKQWSVKGMAVAVVGAQFGSEGKGAVVQAIADQFDVHIRTGGPNAGHTIYHGGKQYKMQSIPCGWINPNAQLVIGAGAVIHPEILLSEIEMLEADGFSITNRLWVDHNAGIITPAQVEKEGHTKGDAHQLIGSTGEGVGVCRMAKINRNAIYQDLSALRFWTAESWLKDLPPDSDDMFGQVTHDTEVLVYDWMRNGKSVLLEGTQGSGLSLTHGTWPYVTSSDTNAAQLAADAGIAPQRVVLTLLVVRTFPIRVAGNSGPLAGETTWEKVGVPPEFTTVTKKQRRVGSWDAEQVRKAVRMNDAFSVVLTFLDYIYPELLGVTDPDAVLDVAGRYIRIIEAEIGARVAGVGTGGANPQIVWLP